MLVLQEVVENLKSRYNLKFVIYADDGLIGWDSDLSFEQVLKLFDDALALYGVSVATT